MVSLPPADAVIMTPLPAALRRCAPRVRSMLTRALGAAMRARALGAAMHAVEVSS